MNEMYVRGILDQIIKDRVKKETYERKSGTYYPSELPFCLRRNFYLYKIHKDLKIGTLLLFESGSIYHRWFSELFENSPLVENHIGENTVSYTLNGITIRGRLDDFVYFKIKKILGQWEPAVPSDTNPPFSSQSETGESEKWKERKEDGMKYDNLSLIEVKSVRNITYIRSPKPHNIMQFMFYLNRFNMTKGFIIYVDRRDLSFKIFEVDYDAKVFIELVDRAKRLHEFLLKDELPYAEARANKDMQWQCSFCNFREECSKGVIK